MEIIDKLMSLNLFKNFNRESLKEILLTNNYQVLKFEKGSTIFNEGEICKSIFIVLDGVVLIEKIDSSGRYFTVGEATIGEMMGPNVLFSKNSVYPLSTKAKTGVELFTINKETLLKLCQDNVEFLESVFNIISSKAFMLTKRLNEVTIQTLKQNIARYLIANLKDEDDFVTLPFTKKEWAESLGVQRPSLSRELKNLEDNGILKVDRNKIEILDRDTLEDLQYN